MIEILKVENPSSLWGRIVERQKEYANLQVKMNLFYHKIHQEAQKIKPSSIEEGQVCVVYFSALKSWCRAIVESLYLGTVGSQAMCFLVDHGERVIVSSDEARVPLEKFLQLPFWMKKYQLAGIHPMRLQVSISEDKGKAELIPAMQWDSSATRYLHNLLQASSRIEAVLCETETYANSTSIELYLTIKNVKICVNDDLVNKKFAYSSSENTHSGALNGVVDRSPAILACDIFTDTKNFLATDGCTVRSLSSCIPSWPDSTALPPVSLVTSATWGSESSSDVSEGIREPLQHRRPRHKIQVQHRHRSSAIDNDRRSSVGGQVKSSKDTNKKTPNNKPQRNSEIDGAGDNIPLEGDKTLVAELSKYLNLFRFLNPASSDQMAVPNTNLDGEKEETDMPRIPGVTEEGLLLSTAQQTQGETPACNGEGQPDGPTVQLLANDVDPDTIQLNGTDPSAASEAVGELALACVGQPSIEEGWACARLLQLLNPDPLRPATDSSDVTIIMRDPSSSGVIVHSTLTVDPCTSLDNAPITDTFRRILQRRKYSGPSVAEGYCWPAVARGCDTVLISDCGDEPLTYIPPFLAHMQLSSVFSTLCSRAGPIAVILCPRGEKAQTVFDCLEESMTTHVLHPMVVLVGLGKEEVKAIKIPPNCQVLVTTPFSLVRLLACHCFLFLRLCHLVLDEVDVLFSQALNEMATILQHFQKVTASQEQASCPKQIVAVGKHWSRHMEGLLTDHMNNPCVIVTVMEEAVLYGNVHQMVQLCLDCDKISVLLGALDLTPEFPQKTLIIANSAEEVEHVFKAVNKTSAFSLKSHEGLTYKFDFVIEQWRKDIEPGTHVILVTTNDCMKALGIRDATFVVHYGFPSSPKLYGRRLFCMSENFRNLSDKDYLGNSTRPVKSVLLFSEKNARHVTGVLRYLKRSKASLPSELLHFAQGILQAKEEQKTERPLCTYLKSFGFCKDSSACPYRHSICPTQDQARHPDSGTIVVLPLYIKTASLFYGRIVSRTEDPYERLAAEMASYYAKGKLLTKEVVEGGLYGVQEEETYHRVRVTSVPDKGERLFSSVQALLLDEGREEELKVHQLLQLPPHFHSLPPQAVEIVLCRVKPIDAEVDWNPKVTRAISQKIRGLQHQAKVVLSLGNTVFVDPMVRMTRLPGLKVFINEYNVHAEILNTGMGTSHPEHLDMLKELCQGAVPVAEAGATAQSPGLEGATVTLEDRMQAAEAALVYKMRAESLRCGQEVSVDLPPTPQTEAPDAAPVPGPCEAAVPSTTSLDTQPNTEQWNSLIANLKYAVQTQRKTDMQGFSPKHWISAVHPSCGNGDPIGEKELRQQIANVENITRLEKANKVDGTKSFHPLIKWFQRENTVVLNIKLTNPVEQSCEFFPDRVVYSGCVNNRPYRANLELHLPVAVERCSWEMKCNEPIITLAKQEQGDWKMLLKQKSNFVSVNFDHFEEDEGKMANGYCFVEHTGENGCYVISESGSESD